MNGVSRFLSRRDKHKDKRPWKQADSKARKGTSSSTDLFHVFTNKDSKKATDKEAEKIKTLLQQLQEAGISSLGEEQVQYALAWHPDDLEQAFNLLVLANESIEGEVKDFDPGVVMLGAVNRCMVTCYLDALLFAMFARLDSFEAMLYDQSSDEARRVLAALLRLWVNMLRTGRLIKVDLTKHLQEAMAKCGWDEAAETQQQDASEAFTFITGALDLPLLTLKMDIYHTGREDKEDDHKFVNERLLEVAIPEKEGEKVTTLEACLETYFNNRIEVKRHLQRQNTLTTIYPNEKDLERDFEKDKIVHIEAIEVPESSSPLVATPTTLEPRSPSTPSRPSQGRRRADSIFTERYTIHGQPIDSTTDEKKDMTKDVDESPAGRPRSASLRKEVMMPAWQFFSLIPWYTDNVPKSDAQVAAHFSAKRPVLGICLKRYTMEPNGTPKRLDTFIDIPLEIGLPHFISDDSMNEEGPLFGNFKLVLQSVVCHRGVSINSGHYISLVRANLPPSDKALSTSSGQEMADTWLRFDDIANPRIANVDIQQALRDESPYLLFFQVQPIDEELASRGDPPPYAESDIHGPSPAPPSTLSLVADLNQTASDQRTSGEWERVSVADTQPSQTDDIDVVETPARSSMSSNKRSSVNVDELIETGGARRSSITMAELNASVHSFSRGRSGPSTPDEHKASFLSTSRRGSKVLPPSIITNKSRPSSQSGENRLSLTLSRLTGRGSKDKLQITSKDSNATADEPVIIVDKVKTMENGVVTSSALPVTTGEPKDSGVLSRSKSKKDKKDEKRRLRGRSKEPISTATTATAISGYVTDTIPVSGKVKEKGKHKAKERPDRECVVM